MINFDLLIKYNYFTNQKYFLGIHFLAPFTSM